MNKYDFIIAGGGCSGMALAYYLVMSSLKHARIAIIDNNFYKRPVRSWSFWTNQSTPFDHLIKKKWDHISVFGTNFFRKIKVNDYVMAEISSDDFYTFLINELEQHNVDFIEDTVLEIKDNNPYAEVVTTTDTFHAPWIFDSTFEFETIKKSNILFMHGVIWNIKTQLPSFYPSTMTFFDFRAKEKGQFFYVMPYTKHMASITCTFIDPENQTLPMEKYTELLTDYIENILHISEYQKKIDIINCIPLSDHSFPRRLGKRVMAIGAKGGLIKPMTGYGFTRILRDSESIVRSLILSGQPFHKSSPSSFYRVLDRLSLRAIKRNPACIETVFSQLFANNNADDIFGFLDESNSFLKNCKVLSRVSPLFLLR